MKIDGCWLKYLKREVVPALAAPTMKKSGRRTGLEDLDRAAAAEAAKLVSAMVLTVALEVSLGDASGDA